jgi:hypothetical protein
MSLCRCGKQDLGVGLAHGQVQLSGLVGAAALFAGVTALDPTGSLAMEIRQLNDGSLIHLSGQVEAGDFEKFEAAVATAKNARVSLSSPG